MKEDRLRRSFKRELRSRGIGLLLAVAALLVAAAPAGAARARWNTRVLSLVPTPGFPAMAYAAPNGRVYEGTYDNPNGDHVPSRVLEIDGDGTLLRSWTMQGQSLSEPHGVQVGTTDGLGRLILLDKSPPRVVVLDPRTGAQSTYATFPAGAIPNYAAWGPDGSLYVTDYGQAILWRIPPRGGTPQPWLQDPRLDGGEFGTTGLALAADHRTLIVGMQSEAGGNALNPSTGRLWKVAIQPDGKPGPMTQLWESRPADGPDGFAIAASGNIYVALLVPNQLAVIAPDGTEKERFPAAPMTGDNGSPVPFDSPSSVRFLGTRLMVANQSYFQADRTHQAVLDVEAGEPGLPELIPPAPQSATPKAKAKKKHKAKKRKKKTSKRRKKRTGRH